MSAEEVAERSIDVSLSAMEEAMSHIEAATCQMTPNQHAVRLIVFGAFAGGIGGVAAYYIGNKYLKAKYEQIAEKEIAEAKEFYSMLNKKEEFSTPKKAAASLNKSNNPSDITVKDAASALQNYQGAEDAEEIAEDYEENEEDEEDDDEEDEEDEEDEGSVNVFIEDADNKDDFDIEEEMRSRTPEHPYVINEMEFLQAEPEFSQTSITYYEGDGTLADERDQEIPFVEPVVGQENLQRFGHGSGDSRVVYIRNERLSSDFEVVKSDGKYAHEVLGLKHSGGGARGHQQRNRPHKFRGGDE